MNETILSREFAVCWPITKAVGGGDDGPRRVTGPVSTETEDFDGQTLLAKAIVSGMRTFEALGSHVDLEHMFRKTKDWDWVIGKGVRFEVHGNLPYLTTELYPFEQKPRAEQVWRHLQANGAAGYSIEGVAKAQSDDGRVIYDAEIYLVTICLQPKNFGSRLSVGELSKAFDAECARARAPRSPVYAVRARLAKAMETGEGVVQPGEEGGPALRVQCLCAACRRKKRRNGRPPARL